MAKFLGDNLQPDQVRQTAAGLTGEGSELVTKIKNWQAKSEERTSAWERSQSKWHRMRMRIKKQKNFPFVGCSNIRMPTIEIKMRKLKAALYNSIFGIRPVVQVVPTDGNWRVARKIEKFLDHLIMEVIKLQNKAVIAIDQELEKGFYLLKPFFRTEITTRQESYNLDDISLEEAMWLFDPRRSEEELVEAIKVKLDVDMNDLVASDNLETLKDAVEDILSGKEEIKINVKDVLYNFPDVALCSPERVYVPSTSGYDPQDCQYIIHEFFRPLSTIRQYSEQKGWSSEAYEVLRGKKNIKLDDKNIDTYKDQREGIERLQSDSELVRVWECFCYHDINGDGYKEKCVVTIAPDFNIELRKITLPFYSGKFPFVKLFYELIDDRWFSHRGIPELIEDIVKEIDIAHMQKIDYGTIANSPMFKFRAGQINKNTMRFRFGQGIAVSGMQSLDDIIKPMQMHNPNIEFSYEREQMILETKVEELIGQVDFSLQSMINKREPRTLGEVQMQQQNMQQVFSLDANLHRNQFKDVFNWIWDLWCQYGDDSYEFAYFGQNEYERIKISKEEIQGKYKILVRGNDNNTNPQVRLQKAQMVLAGMNNPVAIQTGVIQPQNIANAYKLLYQELEVPNWEELVSMPQPKPPVANVKVPFDELTDMEKAQVLKQQGVNPDPKGRYLNEQNRRRDVSVEQLSKLSKTLG